MIIDKVAPFYTEQEKRTLADLDEQQKQKVMNAIKEVSQIDQGEQLDSTPDIGKSSGNGYTEMGKVYKDKDTGKLIMIEG